MESYKRHRLGGLSYQLDYYRNLQNKALTSHEEIAQAANLEAQNKYQATLQQFQSEGKTANTISTTGTTLGTTIGSIGAKNIGKNLWTRFKTARALDSGEKGPTGLTDARYDSDLHNVMYENQEAIRDAPEPVEESAPTPPEEAPQMTEGELGEFADPSISGGQPSTFQPTEMPEPLDGPAMTEDEIGEFADPFTQEARFGVGGTRDQIFDARMGQVNEMAENFQGQVERGEIEPTDLDADPEEGMNFFQKALGRALFGNPQKTPSQLQQEQSAADYKRYTDDQAGEGEDGEVGEAAAEPEIAPAEASDTAGFSSLDEMIAAGNRAGDAENEAGNQGILDEWNNKFGTNYKSLDEVDITDADPPPEPPPRVQSLRARAPKFEVEGAEEGQPGGGTPAEIVSRQPANIEVEGAEVGPDLGDAVPADIVQSAMPAAEADPEVAEMGEEFFRNLASQQSSTADSTLARMGLGGLEHPAAGSQEESAQPKTFEPDAPEPEAEAPSGYKDLPDFGAEETGGEAGGEAAGETAGETIGETAGELGAEEGIEAGLTTAAETADLVAAETAAIPGLDIATAIIGGLLTVGGIGYSVYEAAHQKNDAPKAPQPQAPAPVAPAPSVAGHYVGASADNYFNANQHFQGF